MAAFFDGSDLHLVGAVGFDFFGDFFTHGDALYALAEAGRDRDLTIYLNSPGGIVTDGEGIANAIQSRNGKTTVVVAGVAMSAATIIACAADECVMSAGSLYMVHEPMLSVLYADAAELQRLVSLQKLAVNAYAQAYVAKTGKSDAQVREWMRDETYFGADEAVAAGFADRKSADVVNFAEVAPAFAYDDKRLFANAPQALTALASKKNWRLPTAKERGLAAATGQNKELSMSDNKNGGDMTAELERLRAENATMKASQDADTQAAKDAELEQLRAEKAERENTDAIMALEEATGREAQAKALAAAGVKAEAAKAILAAAPKAEADGGDKPLNGAGLGIGAKGSATAKASGREAMIASMKKLIEKDAR